MSVMSRVLQCIVCHASRSTICPPISGAAWQHRSSRISLPQSRVDCWAVVATKSICQFSQPGDMCATSFRTYVHGIVSMTPNFKNSVDYYDGVERTLKFGAGSY